MSGSPHQPPGRSREPQPVHDRNLVPSVVAGTIRNSFVTQDLRHELLNGLWADLKRFAARNVRNIELSRIRGIEGVRVHGPVVRHGALIVSALAALLECERIFEFGSVDGETSWLLAHNLPTVQIYTFDSEPTAIRGTRVREAAEDGRITTLHGESASFDFSPYSGTIDLVHIDGRHRQRSLVSDTDAAFGLLSELGTIIWYGYTY